MVVNSSNISLLLPHLSLERPFEKNIYTQISQIAYQCLHIFRKAVTNGWHWAVRILTCGYFPSTINPSNTQDPSASSMPSIPIPSSEIAPPSPPERSSSPTMPVPSLEEHPFLDSAIEESSRAALSPIEEPLVSMVNDPQTALSQNPTTFSSSTIESEQNLPCHGVNVETIASPSTEEEQPMPMESLNNPQTALSNEEILPLVSNPAVEFEQNPPSDGMQITPANTENSDLVRLRNFEENIRRNVANILSPQRQRELRALPAENEERMAFALVGRNELGAFETLKQMMDLNPVDEVLDRETTEICKNLILSTPAIKARILRKLGINDEQLITLNVRSSQVKNAVIEICRGLPAYELRDMANKIREHLLKYEAHRLRNEAEVFIILNKMANYSNDRIALEEISDICNELIRSEEKIKQPILEKLGQNGEQRLQVHTSGNLITLREVIKQIGESLPGYQLRKKILDLEVTIKSRGAPVAKFAALNEMLNLTPDLAITQEEIARICKELIFSLPDLKQAIILAIGENNAESMIDQNACAPEVKRAVRHIYYNSASYQLSFFQNLILDRNKTPKEKFQALQMMMDIMPDGEVEQHNIHQNLWACLTQLLQPENSAQNSAQNFLKKLGGSYEKGLTVFKENPTDEKVKTALFKFIQKQFPVC